MRETKKIKQAVILAGGLGSRLLPFTQKKPKPMYEFEGVPFLGHLLKQVRAFGIKEVLLLVGYLPEVIEAYVGDGSCFDQKIVIDKTPVDYDTGARLWHAKHLLHEDFLLLYCDNYCPIDFEKAQRAYLSGNACAQITAYTNRDNYTTNNLNADENGIVTVYDKSRKTHGLNFVDIGYVFLNKKVLSLINNENINFEACVYPILVKERKLGIFPVEHRYYSIGSWERIELTKEFFRPKKVAFLDRDGTLNVKPEPARYITSPKQFVWLEGAKEAVHLLREHGYMLILITNQPGIARGFLTNAELHSIHEKMQKDLELTGDRLDAIYVCPHGWNEGCSCRKPAPGMLFQAQKDFSLNLSETILFGDDERDIAAGRAAGCAEVMQVTKEKTLYDLVRSYLS